MHRIHVMVLEYGWSWWQSSQRMSIEHCSRFAHASSSAKNEWSEGGQLDFIDLLLVQTSFDLFMVGITGR